AFLHSRVRLLESSSRELGRSARDGLLHLATHPIFHVSQSSDLAARTVLRAFRRRIKALWRYRQSLGFRFNCKKGFPMFTLINRFRRRVRRLKDHARRLLLEGLEDRQLLTLTMNHTPYVQLGNATLRNATDQFEILWQTQSTQST